ncbi:TetR family transcriptional regulator [Cypionkella psychrotolerans]|uniref:TetR family transcriptional regulator n=1 Tax=Cypionkella psychrotolerans TaxID=1678131 RepID=UPI0006B518A3|nr:TetR family transcriptional regulator [Cypionkella psychrotolerans]
MRRSKEDAEQTRSAILDAAEQMFCEQGVSASTLEKISRKAGVTRGALYWHFKDKIDLLRALHKRNEPPQKMLIRKAAQEGHSDPLGLLEQVAEEVLISFEQDERQQRVFIILNTHSADAEGMAWMQEMNADMFLTLSTMIQLAHDQGNLSADFTPKETAGILMATMNGLLSEWLRSGKCFSLSDLGNRFLRKQMALFRKPAT